MAVDPAVYASGYDSQSQELRRRDLPNTSGKEGEVDSIESDKKPQVSRPPISIYRYLDERESIIVPVIFTFLALFTRLYKIGLSPIVTWDEAHFGKFGSHYIKREFYFDVHPPLGKMLVGLFGYLSGYNGTYEFKSGTKYPQELNYTFMRAFNSIFGAICVPLAYYTARGLGFKRPAVWLTALMVLCENSYTTISRFILLDSMLLCFTFTTVLCWAKFHRLQNQSFSPEWFSWLFLTGVSIGCVCSVKWVGLFCTALVGIYTAEDLWNKFGDIKMPKIEFIAHILVRVLGLIILPILIYMLFFAIHFTILINSGPGDAQMSSLFQANLRGTSVGKDSPLNIAYGSRATIKNMGYGGGLLHSHIQTYPEGSKQQQVTCYHHKDSNNEWWFYPNRSQPEFDIKAPIQYVTNGDTLRLIHSQTGRNLHSHEIPAPISKNHQEVSCYGNTTIGDEKDHWTIEVIRDSASYDYSKIRTLTTVFRLRHSVQGCYLRGGTVNLPQWGFKQIEVTCDRKNNPRDIYTHWNIEAHWNERLPAADAIAYKSPFFQDFIHSNVAMMSSNNALIPDPDKQDDLASQFWQWPILNVGLRMCSWDDSTVKYFLLGNPIVFWGSTASLVTFIALVFWYIVRWQRGYTELSQANIDRLHYIGLYLFLGWVLHYVPFAAMARVTYVHHYYPALYFAILNLVFLMDWLLRDCQKRIQYITYGSMYAITIGLYIYFLPISWGMVGPSNKYRYMKWFDTWRITD
ncbi:Dolichyl-phosphate-mannose--protein mannosyltransferase 2 [Golovinomyces cichoracearum]|uniref:Dolichyl-phosphate-mannose--protein mannosyltransferase n=1 Tax=Golovinomyces cichoracearum TaxID=62708 RepID=A0A420HMJ7_9PEZI|nr:Dolichyl-phosphate-mannose--protein mannosyltransferase 2 [Golovinomyces cichoracearum]